jgi:heme A synthase
MTTTRYAKLAGTALTFTLIVIVWGAYVRASGSGAGCGNHWPLCKGGIWSMETLIELTHRATSGIALLLTVAMLVFGFRTFPRGHRVRIGAMLSMVFMITEALVGAGLVLFELVAHDASVARGLFMSVHLINTFILLAVMTLTAYWAAGGSQVKFRGQGAIIWVFAACFLGTLVLGVSGALAALSDTLFPATSLSEGFAQDFSQAGSIFLRLRLLHPILAVAVGLLLVAVAFLTRKFRLNQTTRFLSLVLPSIVAIQLVAGLANILLLTPIWLQLVHLVLADLVWIALVLMCSSALSLTQKNSAAAEPIKPASTTGLQIETASQR